MIREEGPGQATTTYAWMVAPRLEMSRWSVWIKPCQAFLQE